MNRTNPSRTPASSPPPPPPSGRAARTFVLLLLTVAIAGILSTLVRSVAHRFSAAPPTPLATPAVIAPTIAAIVPTGPVLAAGVSERRIGIVSGHRGNDSGSVCKDGLMEAQINFDHASRVAQALRALGYTVDVLDEFDPRLQGYKALVFLSIHADSCTYINDVATGYKIARAQGSALPVDEDRLVACLSSRYKKATGLSFHHNTVTANMLEYHGFYKIDALTPAAIIETGFMNLDRGVLTKRAADVGRGITEGLLCFLNREVP